MRHSFALATLLLISALAVSGCDWLEKKESPEPPPQKIFTNLIEECFQGVGDPNNFMIQLQMGVRDGGVIFQCEYGEVVLY